MVGKKTYPRLFTAPKMSYFLFGPRGSGKSTWLRAHYPNAHWIDLLDESRYQSYLANPGLFAGELRQQKNGSWIVVDEVQRLPNLLNEVHRFIESQDLRFVLCGSSARKLKQAGVNLLAGRAGRRTMHPLLPGELGHDFDLESALTIGALPVIVTSPEPAEALRAYCQLYLKEEIQAEALVRNLPGFARFLPVAALMNAQTLNISSLARDAGVARTTVQGYVEILQDTLMVFRLPAYSPRLRVKEQKHPKLYWADTGIPRALNKTLQSPGHQERGALFENWVAILLRALGDYENLFDAWYYWSPPKSSGVEVDFLLFRADQRLALEVKSAARLHPRDFKGLKAIAALSGLKRRMLIHPGPENWTTEEGIEVVSLDRFLEQISSDTLWR